jgi:hypothetical protein
MVQETHVGGTARYRIAAPRECNVTSIANRIRSADSTERAAAATAHGAAAVMTMM